MSKELEELMQKRILGENKGLTEMIEDIMPVVNVRFTDLEIEAEKKQEFSMVVYKKANPFINLFRGIKIGLEKIKIMRHSKEFSLNRIVNK